MQIAVGQVLVLVASVLVKRIPDKTLLQKTGAKRHVQKIDERRDRHTGPLKYYLSLIHI